MNDKKENWFGKTVITNSPIVCIEEDEDLKHYAKCVNYVTKMYAEILETGQSTQNFQDLIKDIENG